MHANAHVSAYRVGCRTQPALLPAARGTAADPGCAACSHASSLSAPEQSYIVCRRLLRHHMRHRAWDTYIDKSEGHLVGINDGSPRHLMHFILHEPNQKMPLSKEPQGLPRLRVLPALPALVRPLCQHSFAILSAPTIRYPLTTLPAHLVHAT